MRRFGWPGIIRNGWPSDIRFRHFDLKEIIYVMQVIVNTRKSSEKIGSIKLRCTFHVPNFEEYILNNESGPTLPQDLLYLLNTVVIGTMRGIMFSEFRGTVLNDALLPVLDPRQFQKTQ
jgi:hypothetical protein